MWLSWILFQSSFSCHHFVYLFIIAPVVLLTLQQTCYMRELCVWRWPLNGIYFCWAIHNHAWAFMSRGSHFKAVIELTIYSELWDTSEKPRKGNILLFLNFHNHVNPCLRSSVAPISQRLNCKLPRQLATPRVHWPLLTAPSSSCTPFLIPTPACATAPHHHSHALYLRPQCLELQLAFLTTWSLEISANHLSHIRLNVSSSRKHSLTTLKLTQFHLQYDPSASCLFCLMSYLALASVWTFLFFFSVFSRKTVVSFYP